MSTDPAEAAQLTAELSDAIRSGQDRLALEQLSGVTASLVEAIAGGRTEVQEVLHVGLADAAILLATRTGATPGEFRIQGMIEALGGVADTAIRTHGMADLSSAGPHGLALRVLREVGRSRGLLSDKAIAHALGVRTAALRPTLERLQASSLVQASPSLGCTLFVVTRRGLDAIRASHAPERATSAKDQDTDAAGVSPGMRR